MGRRVPQLPVATAIRKTWKFHAVDPLGSETPGEGTSYQVDAALTKQLAMGDARAYGAVADGKADDTAPVVQAINEDGVLWLAPNQWVRLTSAITIPAGVLIHGPGNMFVDHAGDGLIFNGAGCRIQSSVFVGEWSFHGTTDVNLGTDEITLRYPSDLGGAPGHTFTTGTAVIYYGMPALPGLVYGTTYYVRDVGSGRISLHPTSGDASGNTNKLNITGTDSNTHYLARANRLIVQNTTATEFVAQGVRARGARDTAIDLLADNTTILGTRVDRGGGKGFHLRGGRNLELLNSSSYNPSERCFNISGTPKNFLMEGCYGEHFFVPNSTGHGIFVNTATPGDEKHDIGGQIVRCTTWGAGFSALTISGDPINYMKIEDSRFILTQEYGLARGINIGYGCQTVELSGEVFTNWTSTLTPSKSCKGSIIIDYHNPSIGTNRQSALQLGFFGTDNRKFCRSYDLNVDIRGGDQAALDWDGDWAEKNYEKIRIRGRARSWCRNRLFNSAAIASNQITIATHPFRTGDRVLYQQNSEPTLVGGLTNGAQYFVIRVDGDTLKLAASEFLAHQGTGLSITATGGSEGQLLTHAAGTGTRVTKTITAVNTGTEQLTIVAHGYVGGEHVEYQNSGGSAIGGLLVGKTYVVNVVGVDTITLLKYVGGGAVDLTSAGSGTHTLLSGADYYAILGTGSNFPPRTGMTDIDLDVVSDDFGTIKVFPVELAPFVSNSVNSKVFMLPNTYATDVLPPAAVTKRVNDTVLRADRAELQRWDGTQWVGSVASGTTTVAVQGTNSGADQTNLAAVFAQLNAGTGGTIILDGTFLISSALTATKPISLRGRDNSRIRYTSAGNILWGSTIDLVAATGLTWATPASAGAQFLTLPADASIVQDRWIAIRADDSIPNLIPHVGGGSQRPLEIYKIIHLAGGVTADIGGSVVDTYTTSPKVIPLTQMDTMNGIVVENLILENVVGRVLSSSMVFNQCQNVLIDGVRICQPGPGAWIFENCCSVTVRDCECAGQGDQDNWYGCLLTGGSNGFHMTGGFWRGCRHVFTTAGVVTTGATQHRYGTPTNVLCNGMTIEVGHNTGLDTHPEGYGITFQGNVIRVSNKSGTGFGRAMSNRARRTHYIGNTVLGSSTGDASGTEMEGILVSGPEAIIEGNYIYGVENAVRFGGLADHRVTNNIIHECKDGMVWSSVSGFAGLNNSTFEHNHFLKLFGYCFRMFNAGTDNVIRGNYMAKNGGSDANNGGIWLNPINVAAAETWLKEYCENYIVGHTTPQAIFGSDGSGGSNAVAVQDLWRNKYRGHNKESSAFPRIMFGAGDPNSTVVGWIGDLYVRTAGGANTTLYVKESGAGTNTGWTAK